MKNLIMITLILLSTLNIKAQKEYIFAMAQFGVVSEKTGDVIFTDACAVNVFQLLISKDRSKITVKMTLLNDLVFLSTQAELISYVPYGNTEIYTLHTKEIGAMSIVVFNSGNKPRYMVSYGAATGKDGNVVFKKRLRSYRE